MLRPVALPDGRYSDDAKSFVAQDILNLIRVNAEQPGARSAFQLKTVPGLKPFCAVANISRQRGAYVCEGRLLVVMDQSLLLINSNSGIEVLGDIPGSSRCSFSHNQITNGNQVLITTGTQGFIYDTVSGDVTQITDDGFLAGLLSVFIGNRFVSLDPARRFFQPSELADGTAWNSTLYELGESDPDRIRSMVSINNELVLLSERTCEHFAYTGDQNELFSNKGISIKRGCAATHAVSVLDNAIFFPGDDGSMYEKRGYELRRISTHAIEQEMANYDLSKAFAFAWEDHGHKVWYITLPARSRYADASIKAGTWGYDLASRTWHRRSSFGMDRWRLAWCVQWNGGWYGGEFNGGRIFRLDWLYPLEGSDPLEREFAPGVLHKDGNWMQLHSARLEVERGPDVDPVTVAEQTPLVITGTLADGTVGVAYSSSLDVSGGTPPYSGHAVISGTLPPGVTLTTTGGALITFAGTPT